MAAIHRYITESDAEDKIKAVAQDLGTEQRERELLERKFDLQLSTQSSAGERLTNLTDEVAGMSLLLQQVRLEVTRGTTGVVEGKGLEEKVGRLTDEVARVS